MSIVVREDKSYLSEIDLVSIERGVAELGIHSIRLDRHFTEEQKLENRTAADRLSKEEWSERCEQTRLQVAEKIESIMEVVNENFQVYQYKDNEYSYSKDKWDLFFWCNCGDMSYVTLSLNERQRTNEEQIKDINKAIDLIKTIDVDGVSLTIQYTCNYNDEKVRKILQEMYVKLSGKDITYRGVVGKIKEVGTYPNGETAYGFFKKGAKTKYYSISQSWLLQQAFGSERESA